MTSNIIPFNPLDTDNLGASVAEALLTTPPKPLGSLEEFNGAGIYALYYCGGFPAYSELVRHNSEGVFAAPIYVGKAVPAGSRKGIARARGADSRVLYSRLAEHATSIRSTETLDIDDFHVRFLVVEDIWIPLGESLLIARYSPVWNSILDGFGNHDPGSHRYEGLRPRWDALHPGRTWALRCKPRLETPEEISQDVETYLRSAVFPTSTRFISV